MINTDRIVPIQKCDYLSMIGTIMKLNSTSFSVLKSGDIVGNFSVTGTGDVGNKLADQPVLTLGFASGVTAGVVYFVADAGFKGFTVAGTAVTATGDVIADGVTLHTATLSGGAVTVAKITP